MEEEKLDLYRVLGVDHKVSLQGIDRAYRQKAFKFHPDRNPGDAVAARKFREVQLAYEVLSDTKRRYHYERTGEYGETEPDNSHRELTKALAVAFNAVLQAYRGGPPKSRKELKGVDYVAGLREYLTQMNMSHEADIRILIEEVKELENCLGRFTEKDERGLLEGCTRSEITRIKSLAEDRRNKIRSNRLALEYLKECSYRKDSFFDMFNIPESMRFVENDKA